MRIKYGLTALAIIVLLPILYFYVQWRLFLSEPLLKPGQHLKYHVTQGANLRQIATQLHDLKLISHPRLFIILGKLGGSSTRLQAGEYDFSSNTTPSSFLQKMVDGDVTRYKFTIIEGWTYQQLRNKLKQLDNIKHSTNDSVQLKQPEGWFYPDTYYYTQQMSSDDILQRAHQAMREHLQREWEQRDQSVSFKTTYEALIVASIIEKETAVDIERPLIASVIQNRLHRRMRLQMDPTVIYAMGKHYKGALNKRNLKMHSAFNTYVRRGLPPTPIAMPSLASLRAALNPAHTNYLYFVAKGNGSHVFSSTLAQQNRAVVRYQLKRDS